MHEASNGTYGAPRIHAELAASGWRHGRKRIARRMRAAGVAGKSPRRWKTTTVADPDAGQRPDLVERDFTVDAAAVDTRWCGDITNGLLRQYFPKGTDLARWNTDELEAVAATLNGRPRKALGWRTPGEALNDLLSSTQDSDVATTG